MRLTAILAALVATAAAAPSLMARQTTDEGYLIVDPGKVKDMIVSEETTLNGTHTGPPVVEKPDEDGEGLRALALRLPLPLTFVNNFGGSVNAYVTGKAPNGAVCFVLADGTVVYPSSGGSGAPVPITQRIANPVNAGQRLTVNLPFYLESGRIYFSAGNLQFAMVATPIGDGMVQPAPNNLNDPSAGINWGFVELTLTPEGELWANLSYVDFIGMILGIKIDQYNGGEQLSAYGLGANGVAEVCNDLRAQAPRDGRPWDRMCIANSAGQLLRVLSPNDYSVIDSQSFNNYWQGYVDAVWNKYRNEPLIIDTQNTPGRVNCWVRGDLLQCDNDNRGFTKPSATDIWGCNGGPFLLQPGDTLIHEASIPRLCAAFHRSTLLLDGGNVQPGLPASSYYRTEPTNHYASSVAVHKIDGKGYAFPYEEPSAHNENNAGLLRAGEPSVFTVYIGGQPFN